MADNVLQLPEPLFLTLKSPDGSKEVKVDVFWARRFLNDAEKQPTEEARWNKVLLFLAEKLELSPNDLAENMPVLFNNAIMELYNKAVPTIAKEHFPTASLGDSIQASQEAIQSGQSS